MTVELIIGLLVAIVACIAGYYLGGRNNKELNQAKMIAEGNIEELKRSNERIQQEKDTLASDKDQMSKELSILIGKTATAEAEKAEAERKLTKQQEESDRRLNELKEFNEKRLEEMKKQIDDKNEQMKNEFEILSTKILKSQGEDFSKLSSNAVNSVVEPMKEQLKQMKEQVERYYADEGKQRGELEGLVKSLKEQSQQISNDANNLANALKGDSKLQGNWGEMILQELLEQSGLKEGEQYFTQEMLKDDAGNPIIRDDQRGNEKKMIPDVIVRMPNNKNLVIDSKVSLTAYTEAMSTDDNQVKETKLKAHVASVRSHIKELKEKNYDIYVKNSPNFVVMFIPNENAYYEAMKADSQLWNEAYKNNILLVNQTNLITLIKLAVDLWANEAREQNYQNALQMINNMYEKYCGFTDNMYKIGKTIESLQGTYGEAVKQLSTGKGNLGRQMEKLKDMKIVSSNKTPSILPEQTD